MNVRYRNRMLGLAAVLGITLGVVTTFDGNAQGHMGNWGTPGFQGTSPMMMGGMMGHHGPMGRHGGMGRGMMGDHGLMHGTEAQVTQHLESLKTRLSITSEQETAWDDYADALADLTGTHRAMFTEMHSGQMGTTEQQQTHESFREVMLSLRGDLQQATQTLLGLLTDVQKQRFTQNGFTRAGI
ncbi:Spy/CpxP family protein refolding chaperone [Magnetococcus sp. PR-3]|uniref:Spy/CpxP family protein refolding chaperone n=1 Tax=Magnetococcus sp. PR-3 TaxID=3120355 RepID=UPI002FCE00E1